MARSLLVLLLAGLLSCPASPAKAAEAACQPPPDGAAVEAATDGELATVLPRPFQAAPWPVDRAALLRDTQGRVLDELAAIGAPSCYVDRVPRIAARVAFLQPLEFLVAGYYDQDPTTRDSILELYGADPGQALRRMSAVWPSPRTELLARTPAFFNLSTNQIYVNTAVVRPDLAPNVLAHEFWHALADLRLSVRQDGATLRTTGFWTQVRPPDGRAWHPLDENVEGGIPTYLMDEAVASEMEVVATGLEHPGMRPDLIQAVEALHRMFAAAGRDQVLRLYLESRSDDLKAIAHQTAASTLRR